MKKFIQFREKYINLDEVKKITFSQGGPNGTEWNIHIYIDSVGEINLDLVSENREINKLFNEFIRNETDRVFTFFGVTFQEYMKPTLEKMNEVKKEREKANGN